MFNNKLKQQIEQLTQSNLSITTERDKLLSQVSNLTTQINTQLKTIANLESNQNQLQSELDRLDVIKDEIKLKQSELNNLQSEIDTIESTNYIQTLGFYDLKYDSKYYQDELRNNRAKQKIMLSNKSYFDIKEKWYVNGNVKNGNKLLNFLLAISIKSYNLFCDNTMDKVDMVNKDYIATKLKKTYDSYNKELTAYGVELSADYLNLKLDEINIRLNIHIAKENEKEEENRRKEILREQVKAESEIKRNKEKLEKELLHYQIQLNKGADVQDKIDEIESKIETEDYMLSNTRAGYVYIISNASLGHNVYKIGITRRISNFKGDDSPCAERIHELSGSNIPFKFKPNCIMWSDDCFALESALHKEFSAYRVNKIKTHREFFKLPLSQIEKVVKEKYEPNAIFDYDVVDEDFVASGYILADNFVDKSH